MSQLYFAPSVIHGSGSIRKLGEAMQQVGITHPFIICSKRTQSKLQQKIKQLMKMDSIAIEYFTEFTGEPTTDHLNRAVDQFKQSRANGIVVIGGGTPIDLAKAVAVLTKEDQLTIKTLHQQKQLQRYPLIAIPTTAGTGSEVTKIAVITDTNTSIKYNPAHPRLIPDVAILDPEQTLDLPKEITAQTGMDALAHAMEAYVSTIANPISDTFALDAIKLIRLHLKKAYDEPTNLDARDGMLRASFLAGLAFSNASTNLAHATARPLGARFHLPHGLSVALTLSPVIEFGQEVLNERYGEVARVLDVLNPSDFVERSNQELAIYEQAKKKLNANDLLKAIPTLTQDALSGNGIQTNAKLPTETDIEKVYQAVANKLMEG